MKTVQVLGILVIFATALAPCSAAWAAEDRTAKRHPAPTATAAAESTKEVQPAKAPTADAVPDRAGAGKPAESKGADAKAGDAKGADKGGESPQAVAAMITAFYAKTPGIQAKFVQAVKKKGLATPITRTGQAWIKKGDVKTGRPGKLRWEYPVEEIAYFCNGETLWSYEKRERTATKIPIKNSQLWQATAYLTGQGDLTKDFSLSLTHWPTDDAWALKLTPLKGTQVMKSLTLLVDKKTGEVRGSVLVDPLDDSSTLQWQEPRYGEIEDKTFDWTPPAGVTVKTL